MRWCSTKRGVQISLPRYPKTHSAFANTWIFISVLGPTELKLTKFEYIFPTSSTYLHVLSIRHNLVGVADFAFYWHNHTTITMTLKLSPTPIMRRNSINQWHIDFNYTLSLSSRISIFREDWWIICVQKALFWPCNLVGTASYILCQKCADRKWWLSLKFCQNGSDYSKAENSNLCRAQHMLIRKVMNGQEPCVIRNALLQISW